MLLYYYIRKKIAILWKSLSVMCNNYAQAVIYFALTFLFDS